MVLTVTTVANLRVPLSERLPLPELTEVCSVCGGWQCKLVRVDHLPCLPLQLQKQAEDKLMMSGQFVQHAKWNKTHIHKTKIMLTDPPVKREKNMNNISWKRYPHSATSNFYIKMYLITWSWLPCRKKNPSRMVKFFLLQLHCFWCPRTTAICTLPELCKLCCPVKKSFLLLLFLPFVCYDLFFWMPAVGFVSDLSYPFDKRLKAPMSPFCFSGASVSVRSYTTGTL